MDADEVDQLLADLSDSEDIKSDKGLIPPPKPGSENAYGTDGVARHEFVIQLDNEMASDLAALQALYDVRFDGLITLGLPAAMYARAVLAIGPGIIDRAPLDSAEIEKIAAIVGKPAAVSISISCAAHASTELGDSSSVSDAERDNKRDWWDNVVRRANRIIELHTEKQALIASVTRSVEAEALNLTAILSRETAAELLVRVGGLKELAATSAANLVGRNSVLRSDPIIQEVPETAKRAALRIVAGKAVLAARIDLAQPKNALQGQAWRRNIEMRIDKLLAPPPSMQHRALPVPIERKSKRRGGKRLRRAKQRLAPTELAMERNTLRFGPHSNPE